MLKIAICDNNASNLNKTVITIQKFFSKFTEYVDYSIKKFSYITELEDYLKSGNEADVIFLGGYSENVNLIDAGRIINNLQPNSHLTLMSDTQDFAFDAYSINASGYILKPIDENVIFSELERAIINLSKGIINYIAVPSCGGISKIAVHKIVYVEHITHKLYIHTKNGEVITTSNSSLTLSDLSSKLTKDIRFIVPHRAFIVNMEFVKSISFHKFTMDNGSIVPIAYQKYSEIKNKYIKFLSESDYALITAE